MAASWSSSSLTSTLSMTSWLNQVRLGDSSLFFIQECRIAIPRNWSVQIWSEELLKQEWLLPLIVGSRHFHLLILFALWSFPSSFFPSLSARASSWSYQRYWQLALPFLKERMFQLNLLGEKSHFWDWVSLKTLSGRSQTLSILSLSIFINFDLGKPTLD